MTGGRAVSNTFRTIPPDNAELDYFCPTLKRQKSFKSLRQGDSEAAAADGPQRRRQRRRENPVLGSVGLPVGGRLSIDRMPRLAALRPIPDSCRVVGRSAAGGRVGFPDAPSAADLRTSLIRVCTDITYFMPPSSARSKACRTNVDYAIQVRVKKARTSSTSSRLDEAEQVSHIAVAAFSARCTRCTLLFHTFPP